MKKFRRSIIGYNVHEVNTFIDDVIKRVDSIIREEQEIKKELNIKDSRIHELEEQLDTYKDFDINYTSLKDAESIKRLANSERDVIINDARKNANRIVGDALIRAEKTEYQAMLLKKNINLFKSRVRVMLNQQLDIIDDLDKEELN